MCGEGNSMGETVWLGITAFTWSNITRERQNAQSESAMAAVPVDQGDFNTSDEEAIES
jgi:hypothetical protein